MKRRVSRSIPTRSGTPPTHIDTTTPPGASETRLDAILVLEIAAESECDPRSVRRRLRGERVRGLAGDRIDRTLARRGLLAEVCR